MVATPELIDQVMQQQIPSFADNFRERYTGKTLSRMTLDKGGQSP